jgi:hypothetical protein
MGSGVFEFYGVIIKLLFYRCNSKSETSAKSASLNARMMTNIYVSLAWMPVKTLLAHGCANSAVTSKNIGQHGGNTFNVAATGESRELYLNIARLTLFGCSRHPDAKPVIKLQTINLEPVTT